MLEFEQKLTRIWPVSHWGNLGVVLAVSGGADSVALLRAFSTVVQSSPEPHVVAHFNHGLRPPSSDEDEQFVACLSESLGLKFVAGHADCDRIRSRAANGLEATARRLRYEFLDEVAQRNNCKYVATAHTADDQVETVLHRILRGTGLGGLAGIPFTRPLGSTVHVVRPLLEFSRAEVLQYLRDLGQSYRHDASNDELHFTRNRIRHQLLPLLRQSFNQQIEMSVLRLAQLAAEAQQVINQRVQKLQSRAIASTSDNQAVLHCDCLRDEPRYVVRELLIDIWRTMDWPQQSMGFREWDLLADFAQLGPEELVSHTRMFPGEITARKTGGQLTLTRP